MKIGNGPLDLCMIEAHFKGKDGLSVPQVEGVTREALDFYPLGEIFHLDTVRSMELSSRQLVSKSYMILWPWECGSALEIEKEVFNIRARENPDVVVVVGMFDGGFCRSRDKLIVCQADATILAHELGHALGLKHPFENCGSYLVDGSDIRNSVDGSDIRNCSSHVYTMCAMCYLSSLTNFSPEDIAKLREGYLGLK